MSRHRCPALPHGCFTNTLVVLALHMCLIMICVPSPGTDAQQTFAYTFRTDPNAKLASGCAGATGSGCFDTKQQVKCTFKTSWKGLLLCCRAALCLNAGARVGVVVCASVGTLCCAHWQKNPKEEHAYHVQHMHAHVLPWQQGCACMWTGMCTLRCSAL